MADRFYQHPSLPFVECRHSTNSGRSYKPHIHKTFSVGAIDRGAVIYSVGGVRATLESGSLALINPETLHSCNPTEFSRRSYYMLFLDVAWCLLLQQSLWQTDTYRPVNAVMVTDSDLYRRYLDTVTALKDGADPLDTEHRLVDLMVAIFRSTCEPVTESVPPSLQIERVKQALSARLDAEMSMRQIASRFEVNPYTLLRQFKAAAGITPYAYRLNCRIERAKTLLREGLQLSQVALECGFYDQSHFHRHFKALTAVTPGEYQVNFVQSFPLD